MSGVEAIAVLGAIDACIGITDTILKIGRAVHDAHGLPPKLRDLFDRLPEIEEVLQKARDTYDNDQVALEKNAVALPLFKQCEEALTELRNIIYKACPNDDKDRKSRLWRGAKTVFFGRESKVQPLLVTIQDNLKLLEQQEIYVIGDKLDELQELTETLGQDDNGKYAHSGAGIVAIEGGTSENHIQGGSNNRMIIKPMNYHEGG